MAQFNTRGLCLVLLVTLATGASAFEASKTDLGSVVVRRLLNFRRGRSLLDDAKAPAPGPMAKEEGEEYEPVTPRTPGTNPTVKMQSADEEGEVYAPAPAPAKEEEEVYETVVPANRPSKVIYTASTEDGDDEVYAPAPAPKAEEEGEYEPVQPRS